MIVDESSILSRLIGNLSLEDVNASFNGPLQGTEFSCTSTTARKGEVIVIKGEFFADGSTVSIGHFERRLLFQGGYRCAHHVIMEIHPTFRYNGIGSAHYREALRFYERNNYRKVTLNAAADGVVIWPQFGFDLVSGTHKQQLYSSLRKRFFPELPPTAQEIFAPYVASPKDPAWAIIGLESLNSVYAKNRENALPMVLDFTDKRQRDFLRARGILEWP